MPHTHLMVDIETMSTAPNAAILSIGAVMFDPYSFADDSLGASFLQTISMESQPHRHFDPSTIAWWLQQSREAQSALFVDTTNLNTALSRFSKWLIEQRPDFVWAKSPSFDLVIIKSAFAETNIRWPTTYSRERDVRTAIDLAFPNGDAPSIEASVKHDALSDAIQQAILVQACYAKLA